ncbi:nuclear transport factor 2 family protein [Brevundimonas sp.]|uniref:nuclear transport factor 2 family protein n=1 Tax=Brevundimonas sp. TaxID=1871086 RepID=UPI003D101C36
MSNTAPTDPAAQLQWLVDRALIGDHLIAFARAIDEKNQPAYAALFTEDARIVLPHGSYEGQDAIRTMRGPPPTWGTQHIHGNYQIAIDGDQATARAYVIASHTFDRAVLDQNARAGGWYDTTLVRTADGWRFSSLALTIVWNTGQMIPKGGPSPA